VKLSISGEPLEDAGEKVEMGILGICTWARMDGETGDVGEGGEGRRERARIRSSRGQETAPLSRVSRAQGGQREGCSGTSDARVHACATRPVIAAALGSRQRGQASG
jgi:hypothetical protein